MYLQINFQVERIQPFAASSVQSSRLSAELRDALTDNVYTVVLGGVTHTATMLATRNGNSMTIPAAPREPRPLRL